MGVMGGVCDVSFWSLMTEKVPHSHTEKMGERQAGREEVCRELEWFDLRKRPSQEEDSRDVGGRGAEVVREG